MRLRRILPLVSLGLVLRTIGCAAPTQALVRVEFLVPCATDKNPGATSITDYAVYVGKASDNLTTFARDPVARVECGAVKGENTLMLYPSDVDALDVIVQVVAGTRTDEGGKVDTVLARNCSPTNTKACIRATRGFRYVRNETLYLPIRLDARCVGRTCEQKGQTCVAGDCVSPKCADGKVLCQSSPPPPVTTSSPPLTDASDDSSPPIDASDPPVDAGPFPFAFTCSGGIPSPLICPGSKVACFNTLSQSYVCSRSQGGCDAGQNEYRPCCTMESDAGDKGRCCLTDGSGYPVHVPNGVADPCSPIELCFGIGKSCGTKRVCTQDPRGDSGWGYCPVN